MNRIQPARIQLTLATGLKEFCGRSETVSTYEEATNFITELKRLFPGAADEKIDFEIEFKDGKKSDGTIKCNKENYTNFATEAFSGISRLLSNRPDDQEFLNLFKNLEERKNQALEFATTYDVGRDYSKPTQQEESNLKM